MSCNGIKIVQIIIGTAWDKGLAEDLALRDKWLLHLIVDNSNYKDSLSGQSALLKDLQNKKAWDLELPNQGTGGKPKSIYDGHLTG